MTTETLSLGQMVDNLGQPPDKPAPKETNAAALIRQDAERRERERLGKRKQIRLQIEQREKLMQTVADLEAQLKLLDQRADAAAADHQAKTEPIQEKLRGAAGDKRSKLLQELTAENIRLEELLVLINKVRGDLTRQHRETRTQAAGLPTEQFLISVGKPALLVERFAADRRLQHAQQRVEMARDQLSQLEPALQQVRTTPLPQSSYGHTHVNKPPMIDCELVVHYSRRVSEWRHELLCASQELQDSEQELQRIAAAMVAE